MPYFYHNYLLALIYCIGAARFQFLEILVLLHVHTLCFYMSNTYVGHSLDILLEIMSIRFESMRK